MPPRGPGLFERLSTITRFAHKQVEWAGKYGPIYRTWDPFFGTSIHVADPDIMYDIAVRVGNLYRAPCAYGRLPAFAEKVTDTFGASLTGSIGEEWRWRKDSILRQFTNSTLLCSETKLLEAMVGEAERLCEALGRAADKGELVQVDALTTHAATAVMLFHMFGRRPEFDEDAFREGSKNLMTVLAGFLTPGQTKARLRKLEELKVQSQSVFDKVSQPELEALLGESESGQRDSGRFPCMMEKLLKQESRYSRNGLEGLLADARVFVNAGFETTAHALAFAFGLLAEPRNAAVADLAHKEAVKAVADGLQRKTLLEGTAYFDKIFHETLRLIPPAPTTIGVAYQDFELDVRTKRYLVPKEARLFMHNLAGQRCARVWSEPDAFKPERWGEDASRRQLMAFNLGAHACPGKNLSLLEARVFLSMVLSKFRFKLPPGVESVEWYEELLMRPKNRMPLLVYRV